jgi:hypothetical protein
LKLGRFVLKIRTVRFCAYIGVAVVSLFASCSLLRNRKTGCPTDGKNVGAEKLASGDPKALKAAKKAKKFKA